MSYGDPTGKVTVAVVGNSHAIQWMPAVDRVAKAAHWRVVTYLDSECTPSTVVNSREQWSYAESAGNCLAWGRRVQRRLLSSRPDLVLMSDSSGGLAQGASSRTESMRLWTRGYREWLRPLVAAGTRVAVLRDTPWGWTTLKVTIPECMATHPDGWRACGGPRDTWVRPDPTVLAARELGAHRVAVVDMTDYLCTRTYCPPAVGGVLVYQDGHHLTKTYVESLAPYLAATLTRVVSDR